MTLEMKCLKELEELRREHASLKEEISAILRESVIDQFRVQSLKKRKLIVKDQIGVLEDRMVEDIIA